MSIRNLESLFAPRCVAVFGASDRAHSVGATVWRNLARGFQGELWAVNPRQPDLGVPVARDLDELPVAPDLAVICTPAATVPGLIARLGARGTRAAVVVTAGLSAAQKQAMLDAARRHTVRILGPNCIGMLVPHLGLNASFAHADARPGQIAFLSQSGALVTAVLDWANDRGIGFSHFVSLGDGADVDFGDLLDYLGSDARTRAILMYVESISAPRKFMSAARAAARNKPVILVKSGRSAQGSRAAASHTGALAGADDVFDAAISRAGMLRVNTLHQLFLAVELLARFRDNRSERLLVLTNGGGAGVMAADAAAHMGVELATLSPEAIAQLDAVLPGNWSRSNPVDIIGDAPATRYVDALRVLRTADRDSAILFIQAPTAIVPSETIAEALLPLVTERPPRVLGCWLGHGAVEPARARFRAAGVPDFPTPEEAVRAFSFLRQYHRHQAELLETPPALPEGLTPDLGGIRRIVQEALQAGRQWLTEPQAKALLACAGVPVTPIRTVPADPDAAAAAADALGYPVVLKILSEDITHKSDVGGVRLDLHDAQEVREAARAMLQRVTERRPHARIEGLTVQPMVRRRHAHELIVGASIDPLFGPVILFGQGGTAVEVLADRALALPPLNVTLAEALIERTRVARLLRGYRDVPPAHRPSIHRTLLAVSQLLADVPEIAEIDINPLIVDAEGAIALDARVRVSADCPAGARHFAIRPYPQELVQTLDWHGTPLTVRPIRPEDEAQHLAFLEKMDPEDIRLRIFYSRRSIEHSELARLTQIDYDREMAFIATRPTPDGGQETIGVVRGICDPDNDTAEYGILVRSDLKGRGLGRLLMQRLIDYLRAHGTRRIVGTVLRENQAMLALVQRLGFQIRPHPEDPDLRCVELPLQPSQ
ncbi:bifunctional acetate--CoA ligase family protein/GNAT family N-acetyltransferase [Tepidimonas charontis]|uniref:Succinate--CoA ligase ADP-forming subunit alpha n=1 Tax=Tepidimonas charontis TaxID=2267262 RepID=A0A554X4Q1_9BURK|nr:bifunctional acetate--CoA ligase family protein/GNAT family N-acetyltransferase [Tepidimonas charontis]TSE30798.1 Succinate--CoA ligase ADP-forming subunit alpha [Tepidimonas charontis]